MSGKVSNTLQIVRRLDKVEKEVALLRSDVNERLSAVNESLIRVSTEVVSVVTAVNQVRDVLVDRLEVRGKVDELDRRVSVLERKAG